MDPVANIFDKWAINGRAKLMEIEHGKNVIKFLETISFDKPFSFLDVGCGNGWVVNKIAKEKFCLRAIGIDKSRNMILQAKKAKISKKERYICTDIESWRYSKKFDFIFSMESIYYVNSTKIALKNIFKLLKHGGKFACGTDFYKDNKATTRWEKMMKISMHLHSKKEWKKLFVEAGFEVEIKQIKDLKNKKKWKRDLGTLFIIGKKPKRQTQYNKK